MIDGASPCFERCQSSRWRQESSISLLREFLTSVLPKHVSRWFDISSRVSVRWRNLGDVQHNESPQFCRKSFKKRNDSQNKATIAKSPCRSVLVDTLPLWRFRRSFCGRLSRQLLLLIGLAAGLGSLGMAAIRHHRTPCNVNLIKTWK